MIIIYCSIKRIQIVKDESNIIFNSIPKDHDKYNIFTKLPAETIKNQKIENIKNHRMIQSNNIIEIPADGFCGYYICWYLLEICHIGGFQSVQQIQQSFQSLQPSMSFFCVIHIFIFPLLLFIDYSYRIITHSYRIISHFYYM